MKRRGELSRCGIRSEEKRLSAVHDESGRSDGPVQRQSVIAESDVSELLREPVSQVVSCLADV